MGISHALYETTEPYYPDPGHGPRDFVEYLMPVPATSARTTSRCWSAGGGCPFGAKGPGEMCANPVMPAVANAIFNGGSVCASTNLPITPEKVLRAIKAQGGARPQARR